MHHALRDTADYKECTGGKLGPPHDMCWVVRSIRFKGILISIGGWVSVSGEYWVVVSIRIRLRSKDKRMRDLMIAKQSGSVLSDFAWCPVHIVEEAPSLPSAPDIECLRVYNLWWSNDIAPPRLNQQTVLH
jgi:hypothetical protein